MKNRKEYHHAKYNHSRTATIPIVLTGKNNAERMKEITDKLEQGIKDLFHSDHYKTYLAAMSKFHNYSFKRTVKKGEKGIKILAPSPYTVRRQVECIDPSTHQTTTEEREIIIQAFKPVTVFDVSQTEGEALPSITVDELTGSVEQYGDFFAALEAVSPVPISFEDIPGRSHGYYHLIEKRIAIQEGMSDLQTLKTAIHEIAHATLHAVNPDAAPKDHTDRPDHRTREVQAESVAYTICQHYGLDTSDYSFGYVAGWSSSKGLSELKNSLEIIRSTAHDLISAIDNHLEKEDNPNAGI